MTNTMARLPDVAMKKPLPLRPKDPIRLEETRPRLSRTAAGNAMDRLRKAICAPPRLHFLEALTTGELCVNDLALAIDRAPAATSQHLRVLREMGMVEGYRQGTAIYYRLKQGAATE